MKSGSTNNTSRGTQPGSSPGTGLPGNRNTHREVQEMETTRERLINIIHRHYRKYRKDYVPNQIGSCSAWYSNEEYDENEGLIYRVLQSYTTPVAIWIKSENTVYRFGKWSTTTAQHQWKFKRLFNAQTMVDLGSNGLERGWR